MDLVELIGHLAEGFGEPGVERGVKFFVDRGAHLFELRCVGGGERAQAGFDRSAELFLVGRVAAGEVGQLGVEDVLCGELGACGFGGEGHDTLGEGIERLLNAGAEGGGRSGVVGAEGFEARGEGMGEGRDGAQDFGAEGGGGEIVGGAGGGGFTGEITADLGELALELGFEAGELVGELELARVWKWSCRRRERLAQVEGYDCDEEDELESEQDEQHFVFPSL